MEYGARLSGYDAVMCRLKDEAEDFIVKEITRNGTVLEPDRKYTAVELGMGEPADGKFSVFVMQKRNWNTVQACREVARKAGRGIKSVGFAGTKDRKSVSTQLCSLFGASPERLADLHVKDVSINGAWRSGEAVELGGLLGNSFDIRLNGCAVGAEDKFASIHESISGIFPNYYGMQRFGTRGNNAEIGLAMLKGSFEDAVMMFLTDTENETNAEAIEAREKLKHELDFKAALGYYPSYLKYELRVIEYLGMYPTDFANALRRIPRQISLMLVHAVESYIFNKELETRIFYTGTDQREGDMLCGAGGFGFPDLASLSRDGGRASVSSSAT